MEYQRYFPFPNQPASIKPQVVHIQSPGQIDVTQWAHGHYMNFLIINIAIFDAAMSFLFGRL